MKIAVCPDSELFYNDEFFNLDSKYNKDCADRYPFYRLKKDLGEAGIELHTCDVGNIRDYSKLLMFNYSERAARQTGRYFKRQDRLLYLIEPPAVIPHMWSKDMLSGYRSFFHRTYLYADNLVDNVNFFKYHIPPNHPVPSRQKMNQYFEAPRRHLLAFIQTNRQSEYPGELYTLRRQLVKYIDGAFNDFHVYGKMWNCKSYRGVCKDKLDVLKDYRFSLAIENQCLNGWISERIFESFFAGCIPIYLGAPNITDYIPANTFIDFRNFATIDILLEHIMKMDKQTMAEYRENIRSFLNSEKFHPFSIENFVKTIAASIMP